MKDQKRKTFQEIMRSMPVLAHWPDHAIPFDVNQSQVVEWITAQMDIKNWLFWRARSAGYIDYDRETGKWNGVPQGQKSNLKWKLGGRPSKVGLVMGMDKSEFLKKIGDGRGFNDMGRELGDWLNGKGVEISESTVRRIIRKMIELGEIVVAEKGWSGKDFRIVAGNPKEPDHQLKPVAPSDTRESLGS